MIKRPVKILTAGLHCLKVADLSGYRGIVVSLTPSVS